MNYHFDINNSSIKTMWGENLEFSTGVRCVDMLNVVYLLRNMNMHEFS